MLDKYFSHGVSRINVLVRVYVFLGALFPTAKKPLFCVPPEFILKMKGDPPVLTILIQLKVDLGLKRGRASIALARFQLFRKCKFRILDR